MLQCSFGKRGKEQVQKLSIFLALLAEDSLLHCLMLSDFCDVALDALGYSAGGESCNRAVEWAIFREPGAQRGGSMQEQGLEYLFFIVNIHMDIFQDMECATQNMTVFVVTRNLCCYLICL